MNFLQQEFNLANLGDSVLEAQEAVCTKRHVKYVGELSVMCFFLERIDAPWRAEMIPIVVGGRTACMVGLEDEYTQQRCIWQYDSTVQYYRFCSTVNPLALTLFFLVSLLMRLMWHVWTCNVWSQSFIAVL